MVGVAGVVRLETRIKLLGSGVVGFGDLDLSMYFAGRLWNMCGYPEPSF